MRSTLFHILFNYFEPLITRDKDFVFYTLTQVKSGLIAASLITIIILELLCI